LSGLAAALSNGQWFDEKSSLFRTGNANVDGKNEAAASKTLAMLLLKSMMCNAQRERCHGLKRVTKMKDKRPQNIGSFIEESDW
jgi:hypothetical protein